MRILISLFLLTLTIVSAAACQSRTDELNGLLSAARQVVDQEGKPKIFASPDGQFELTLDGKWATDTSIIPNALLQAENMEMRMRIVAFRHSESELGSSPTLDIYTKSMQLQFMLAGDKYKTEVKDPVKAKLGKYEAREFETSLANEKTKIKYKFITFKTDNYYYKLVINGEAHQYDLNQAKIRPLLESFQEMIEKKK